MRFKRIYIEITNVCNLKCDFCLPHHRINRYMDVNEFKHILDEIKDFSEYIYFHVKGEPLLHPNIREFIKTAYDRGFKINLTTNGTLLNNILDFTKYLRQINISLHATNSIDIIRTAKQIKDTTICFRIWNIKENPEMIRSLENEFNITIPNKENFKIADNIFLSQKNKFTWPSLGNEFNKDIGFCYGLKDQVAILVDGTVVPCCLDNDGDIALGNIYNQSLAEIINCPRSKAIIEGFKNREAIEKLCKKCSFKDNF